MSNLAIDEKVVPLHAARDRKTKQDAKVAPNNAPADGVLQESGSATTQYLEERMRIMMENIDDALFDMAEKAETNSDQTLYFDAMREVRLKNHTVQSAFGTEVKQALQCFLEGRNYLGAAAADAAADGDLMTMSLVDNDELEEQLAIDGIVQKARRRYEEELSALTKRLAALEADNGLNPDANPMDPKVICEAFVKASETLEVELKVKLIIYKLFDRFVMTELGPHYCEINQFLNEQGILPDSGAARPQTAAAPAGGGGQAAATGTAPAGQAANAQQSGGEAAVDSSGGQDLFGLLQQMIAQRQSASAAPSAGPAPSAGGGHAGVAGNDLGQYAGGATSNAIHYATGTELVPALTQLQTQAQQQPAAAGRPDPQAVKRGLLQQMQAAAGTGQAAGIARTESNTIDIVSILFERVLDDPALSETVKGIIARLQIPVIKVSLLDPSFFNQKQHPARRLINALARAAEGGREDDQDSETVQRIREAVDTVVEQFDNDARVFEHALIRFETWLEHEQERIQAREALTVRQAEEKENRAMAEMVATGTISRIVADIELPAVLDRFLRITWRDLLARIFARYGAGSEVWVRGLNVASLLVWSLLPKRTAQEREQLVQTLPSLLKATRDGMAKMGLDEAAESEILSALAAEHARNVRGDYLRTAAAEADVDERVIDGQSVREDLAAMAASTDPEAAASAAEPAATIEEGQWESVAAAATPSEPAASAAAEASSTAQPPQTDASQPEAAVPDPASKPAESEAESEYVVAFESLATGAAEDADADTAAQDPEVLANRRTFMQNKADEIQRLLRESRLRRRRRQATDVESTAPSDEYLQKVRALEKGTWIEIRGGDQGPLQAKLSWKSTISGKLFFVDRQGTKVAELTEEQLAYDLRTRNTRVLDAEPLVERALGAMLSEAGTASADSRSQGTYS